MSKDLEKEYKALVDSEAPDLWARIGAGLEEKAAHSHREELTKKKWHYKIWAGFAAACVCVALSVPVIIKYFSPNSDNFDIVSPGYNKTSMDGVSRISEHAAGEFGAEMALEESVRPAAIEEEFDVAKEVVEQEESSFIITAEVLEIDVRRDSGILYTVSVIASENTTVQANSEIKIFSSALNKGGVISLEKSQSYQLTLIDDVAHSAEEEIIYTLQAVENQ